MKKLKKWVKSLFKRPLKKVKALMPELKELRSNLLKSRAAKEWVEEIVYFFDYVSKWHDRESELKDLVTALKDVNYGQFTEITDKLDTLQAHFINAGRQRFGMNRTKKDETVTADKVFLGNVFGLFTKPVSFWRQKKDEPKGGWGFANMEYLNSYDVISRQAGAFMSSHIDPMVSIINDLERPTA